MRVAEETATSVEIKPADLHEIFGAPRFDNEVAMHTNIPGVATGQPGRSSSPDSLAM